MLADLAVLSRVLGIGLHRLSGALLVCAVLAPSPAWAAEPATPSEVPADPPPATAPAQATTTALPKVDPETDADDDELMPASDMAEDPDEEEADPRHRWRHRRMHPAGADRRHPPPPMPPPMIDAIRRALGMNSGPGRVNPHALLQVQSALLAGDDNQQLRGDRAERVGFSMRRASLGLTGGLGERVEFGLETDLVDSELLNEAWIGIDTWPGARITVGAQKVPFSRSAMLSSGHTALAERPLAVEAMAPMRQIGAVASGAYERLGMQWHLGAFNGYERDPNFFAGVRENAGLRGNRFNGLSYVARLALEPLGLLGRTTADLRSAGGMVPTSKDRGLLVQVGIGGLYNDGGSTVSRAMSADLHVKLRGVHLLLEWLDDSAQPSNRPDSGATIPAAIERQALIAELGYAYGRGNIAFRFENIQPNSDSAASDERVFSSAIGYQLQRNRLRAQLQYDERIETAGHAVDNRSLFAQIQLML